MRAFSSAALFALLTVVAAGCSSSTTTTGTSDAGSGSDGGGGGTGPALDGCTTTSYVDRTAASADRTVTWDFQIVPDCMTIKAGQTVTFNGNFTEHPLASFGGDQPNPFDATQTSATSRTFTFPKAGAFGFHCENHSSMHGVISVVP